MTRRTANKERIVQLSATSGRFIAIYDSQKEASKATKVASGNISKVVCGTASQVGGFLFMRESKWKAKRGILD